MKIIELFEEIDTARAKAVSANLERYKNQPVTLRINSPGGSVTAGMLMADAIQRHGKVTAEIVGLAASMASVVAVAAKDARMSSTALIMIHNPWMAAQGDSRTLRKEAEALDKFSGSLVTYYSNKTGKSRQQIQSLMDAETWLDAYQAKDGRFIDAIFKGADARAAIRWQTKFPGIIARLAVAPKKTPLQLAAEYMAMPAGPRRQTFFEIHKNQLFLARTLL
jgi:ATP-dependent Clp endopeptidase proteolytic subunit ClpP